MLLVIGLPVLNMDRCIDYLEKLRRLPGNGKLDG